MKASMITRVEVVAIAEKLSTLEISMTALALVLAALTIGQLIRRSARVFHRMTNDVWLVSISASQA